MEDHTTYPALLAAETVPVPLAVPPQEQAGAVPAPAPAWPGLVVKLAAVGLGLWLLKRWW